MANKKKFDWSMVVEFIISVLTLGLSHIKKKQTED